MNVFLVTLGCPKNTVDAEAALSLLRRAGHRVVTDPAGAEVLVVNSCSFLDAAWRETVEQIDELAAAKAGRPDAKLIVMGCLPVHRQEDYRRSLVEVDYFLPSGQHGRLPEVIHGLMVPAGGAPEGPASARPDGGHDPFAGYQGRALLTPAHTAYLKLAEGCRRNCTFCAIPVIRGPLQCRPPENIIREVETHLDRGVREITLIAQDVLSYQAGGQRLPELVASIAATGIDWIRIFYLHPASLTLETVEALFRHDNVCRYLEIPCQHAADGILQRMGRAHRHARVERLLAGIKRQWPDAVLRSEVIVGFPGETESDFDRLRQFIDTAGFASLGIFQFSPEAGTAAAGLDGQVPDVVKTLRTEELQAAQEAISFEHLTGYIGKILPVLVDRQVEQDEGIFENCGHAGRFYGQAYEIDGEVYLRGSGLSPGSFVNARIIEADLHDLLAEVV